jgi:hypothetical protein
MYGIPLALAALSVSLTVAPAGSADAAPIGALPKGPSTIVLAKRGSLVAVALPRQRASTGLVWRLARRVDTSVLRQVSEADVGPSVVAVFRVAGGGTTKVVFALTHGDDGSTAVRAAYYSIQVK